MPKPELAFPKSEAVSVEELFGADRVYRIPEYQRAYSWTEIDVDRLFHDIVFEMAKPQEAGGPVRTYFLGTVIIAERDRPKRDEIVDGQQRLMTLTILMAVLRDHIGSAMAARLDRLIWLAQTPEQPPMYRIMAMPRDQLFLQTLVLSFNATTHDLEGFDEPPQVQIAPGDGASTNGDGLSDAQERYLSNRDRLRELVASLPAGSPEQLAEFVMSRCIFISITVQNLNEASRIFTVLHTRGLPLSYTDILKAEIFDGLDQTAMRRCADAWEGAESRLGRERFGELFELIHLIETGEYLDLSEAVTGFHAGCRPTDDRVGFVEGKLVPLADALQQVRSARLQGFADDDRINRLLTYLNWIDSKGWLSVALVWLHHNNRRRADVERFLGELERFAFVHFILHPSDEARLRRRFIDVIKDIRRKPGAVPSEALKLDGRDIAEVNDRLRSKRTYGKAHCLPLLLRVNAIFAQPTDLYRFSVTEVTAEHILPQQGNVHWDKIFPRFKGARSAGHLSGHLGNLTLLREAENSRLGQSSFQRKKETYQQSQFALTRRLAELPGWTPELLHRRSNDLTDQLMQDWNLK